MCNLTLRYIPVSNFTHRQKADIVSRYKSHYCARSLMCTPCASAAILSALRNLQEKIRRLEREKWQAELNLHSIRRDVSQAHLQSDKVTQTPQNNNPTIMEPETSGWPDCNQGACATNRLCAGIIVSIESWYGVSSSAVLITNLAAAESRCAKLERQLDVMRRLLASQVNASACGAACWHFTVQSKEKMRMFLKI